MQAVLILKIITGLVLFFTFLFSMAIGNGLYMEMWQDPDDARSDRMSSPSRFAGMGEVIRAYVRQNPGGKKHLQMFLAYAIAGICLLGPFLCLWILPWH